MIAQIAKVSVMDVILAHRVASLTAAILVAVLLFLEARLFHQDRATKMHRLAPIAGGTVDHAPASEPVNAVRAAIPMLPLALLLVTVPQFHLTTAWLPKGLTVLEAMAIGVLAGMVVTWASPTKVVTGFFDGMGRAYGNVMGIIIAAGVFIGGLEAAGLIKALIEALTKAQWAVPIFGALGPFVMAVLSGSGDASTLAFNQAVTIHAARFGISPIDLGNLAWLGGALGRSMSPVAAAAIVAAGFAKVNPFELAKRNAIPMLAAVKVIMLIQGR